MGVDAAELQRELTDAPWPPAGHITELFIVADQPAWTCTVRSSRQPAPRRSERRIPDTTGVDRQAPAPSTRRQRPLCTDHDIRDIGPSLPDLGPTGLQHQSTPEEWRTRYLKKASNALSAKASAA